MTLTTIIIIGIIAAAALLIFKSHDFLIFFNLAKKYFIPVFFFGLIVALAFSVYHVFVKYDLSLTSYSSLVNAAKVYAVWVKSLFSNLSGITGYAAKQDWLLNAKNATG